MLEAAVALLRRLRALDDGGLTPLGERLRGLPLHPRLGAVLVAGGGAVEAARACALLADGLRGRAVMGATTTSDVLPGPGRVGATGAAPETGGRAARDSPPNGPTLIDASTLTSASCVAPCWPAIPTGSRDDGGRGRRDCCWQRAPAPNWPATAVSVTPNGWSRSTWPARPQEATPGYLPPALSSASGSRPTQSLGRTRAGRRGARARDPRDVVRRAAPRRSADDAGPRGRLALLAEAYLARPHDEPTRSCFDGCDSSAPTSTCRSWSARQPPASGPSTTSTLPRICHGTFGRASTAMRPNASTSRADARPPSTIATTAVSRRR